MMSECSGKPGPDSPRRGDLLGQHHRVAEVAAATAIFGRQRDTEQAFATCLEPGLAVHDTGLVPLRLPGHTFTFEKTPRRRTELFVIFAEYGSGYVHGKLPAVG